MEGREIGHEGRLETDRSDDAAETDEDERSSASINRNYRALYSVMCI